MVRVQALVVIRRMAARTGVRGIGVIAVVAGDTVIRDRHVRSSEGIDCLVIKRRRRPGCFRVASRAIGRELIGGVVGVCGLVELRRMATGAGVRRIVVITVVAGCAIVSDGRVRTIQSIKIIVDGKGRRRPTGSGGVARRAIGGQTDTSVIRIGGLIKICGVTRRAIRWRACVAIGVAGNAICRNMRAR